MLVASMNYALSLGYALCFLLTGLFSATLLHTYRNLAGLRVLAIKSNPVFAGELLSFELTLENTSKQDRNHIRIKTSEAECSTSIDSHSIASTELKVKSSSRGLYKLDRLTLISDFPLGLWFTWSYIHPEILETIYPTPERNSPPLPDGQMEADGDQFKNAESGDVAGVRNYIEGDNLSAIAWKMAARGQGLFTREFEQEQGNGDLQLSLTSTELHDVEDQLSRLTSWILNAEKNNTQYSLLLPEEELAISAGSDQRKQSLSLLAMHGLQ